MSLLIKNGKVFLEKGFTKLDLHIDEGKIVHIAEEIYPSHKDIIVNAEDSYILPGFIDLITYIEKTKSFFPSADNFLTATNIAILNGITTLGTIIKAKQEEVAEEIDKVYSSQNGNLYSNLYFLFEPENFTFFEEKNFIKLSEKGINSFKFELTLERLLNDLSYQNLIKSFLKRVSISGFCSLLNFTDLTEIKSILYQKFSKASGKNSFISYIIKTLLDVFEEPSAKIHILNVTLPEIVPPLIEYAYKRFTFSTAPHYLFLDDKYLERKNGWKWVCQPSLNSLIPIERLKKLVVNDFFYLFSSDHCAYYKKDKHQKKRELVPPGVAGIGALPNMIYKLYNDNLNDTEKCFEQLAIKLSKNPASLLNLYPVKGKIDIGSDADLVILQISPEKRRIRSSFGDTYETFESFYTNLNFKFVILNGIVMVMDNLLLNKTAFFGNILTLRRYNNK
jgi:dihydropyrimidinase